MRASGDLGQVVGRSWREAVRASGGDPFVRWHVDPAAVREVRAGEVDGRRWWAVRVAAMSYWDDGGLLVSGDPLAAGRVGAALVRATGSPDLTVPAAAGAAGLAPNRTDAWSWLHTTRPLPVVPGEEHVRWDPPETEVTALLDVANPGAFVRPGHPRARRWAGARDADGALVACGAVTWHCPGVPHLAAVTTHPDVRGRGIGGALTAAMTRQLLQRRPAVSLALWSGNEAARRTYARIGLTAGHDYLSGPPT